MVILVVVFGPRCTSDEVIYGSKSCSSSYDANAYQRSDSIDVKEIQLS